MQTGHEIGGTNRGWMARSDDCGRIVVQSVTWISQPPTTMSGPVALTPGFMLGPYQVGRLIGKGGMGEVYHACDTRLNRGVALKVLAASSPTDPERLARFTREAQTTALLNHPNIVAVYDVGSHAGVPFVVTELLDGETVRVKMRNGALPPKLAVRYALEIARGLVAAHQLGVVHRDLKPENIFITRDERVKILDFGLAKSHNETLGLRDSSISTGPDTVLGTVGYMSPEQVRGLPTDHRSDIFSLGVILYEMLAGTAPFRGDSAVETLNAILQGDPPRLRQLVPQIPVELERVVRHCLEKAPDDRFQTARDLIFSLDLTLRPPQRAGRRPKRRPFLSATRRLLAPLFQLW
jgi:serine/threonine protein kinase